MASGAGIRAQSVQRSRQLDFNKAMSNFKVMFPTFDYEVIEMVLRANNGVVDATIDQLLEMQPETNEPESNELLDPELNVRLPSYSDTGAATFDPPPAYTPRVEEDPNFSYDSTFLETSLRDFNTSVSSQSSPPARKNNTHYHPPLLGTLPNDFLRIHLDDRSASAPSSEGKYTENPLYEVGPVLRGSQWTGSRVEASRVHQDIRPNQSATVSRTTVNGFDQGFDAIPSNENQAKCCGKKVKGKKIGQMSRKFRRKKTKSAKGTTYQQMSGANLINEDSGDEHGVQR